MLQRWLYIGKLELDATEPTDIIQLQLEIFMLLHNTKTLSLQQRGDDLQLSESKRVI